MARILNIARAGMPILYQKAGSVKDPTIGTIKDTADDMIATLEHYGGLGLAAPQVHIPLRILILNIPQTPPNPRYDFGDLRKHKSIPLTVMINPECKPLSDEKILGWESCLSYPGLRGKVNRYRAIEYSWQSLDGKKHMDTAEGFNARVIQHECDHLEGILYPFRMDDLYSLGHVEETLKYQNHLEQNKKTI